MSSLSVERMYLEAIPALSTGWPMQRAAVGEDELDLLGEAGMLHGLQQCEQVFLAGEPTDAGDDAWFPFPVGGVAAFPPLAAQAGHLRTNRSRIRPRP